MEYLKAEYRRLVRLFCDKYNQIVAQDIFNKANNRTSDKEKKEKNNCTFCQDLVYYYIGFN